MKGLGELSLWMDPVARPGPESMAVDEWLLETAGKPVLRVYRWSGNWASLGYFGEIERARAAVPGVNYVRRWTGGGLVDHRADWTYSVIVPQGEALARARGAESYRIIHAALVEALAAERILANLSDGGSETGAALCFANPVSHDLVGRDGVKLAGAGQRRTRLGLLHQGSAAVACDPAGSTVRGERLAEALSSSWSACQLLPDPGLIRTMATRYQRLGWVERR